jgi:hypothetical protein
MEKNSNNGSNGEYVVDISFIVIIICIYIDTKKEISVGDIDKKYM